jgi:hypothetical protein
VVENFLLASAIGANHYAVARQYLTPKASATWHPGSAVTILTQEPKVSVQPGRLSGPTTENVVAVSGQVQAKLNSAGQYIAVPGGVTAPTNFVLQYTRGLWKISQLFTSPGKPSNELLLTSDLFHLEYAPRNLYYFGKRSGKLLPYPVFVPIQGTNPAETLINDLIRGPGGWLAGAATAAFPAGARLVLPIQVFPGPSGGRTAVVNIAVPPHSPDLNVRAMAAQLVTTLTSPVYSTPLFHAVKLKINGRPWSPGRHAPDTLSLGTYQRDIPQPPGGENAYYLSPGGVLHSLSAQSEGGSVLLRSGGSTPVALSRIAVAPGGGHLAGLAGPANTVYTASLSTGTGGRQSVGQLRPQFTDTKITSLSWDRLGALWVTGKPKNGTGIWVLPGGVGSAVAVSNDLGRVAALRVAPDGTRVAMIVKGRLVLAGIMHDHAGFLLTNPAPLGPSLPSVSALTWFDEDHLLVVTGTGETTQLWEVPVDGDNPKPLIRTAGILTVTAAGPDNPLYLGLATSHGPRLERADGLNQPLGDITAGQAVIYPG